MTKLYRLIPDSIASIYETNYSSDISEDLFYKLGYITVNDHDFNYFIIHNDGFTDKTKNDIFFFFSPWSCLANLLYLNSDVYACEIARIFEYEVTEEIIKNSHQRNGYYGNMQHQEIKIPFSLLDRENAIMNEINTELKKQLANIALYDANESFKYLQASLKTNPNSELEYIRGSLLDGSLQKEFFASNILEEMNIDRLSKCGNFCRSNIVTGKSKVITLSDRNLFCDFLRTPEQNIQEIYDLCKNSDSILTKENLKEYIIKQYEYTNLGGDIKNTNPSLSKCLKLL